ncbi:hypothetical protein V6N13_039098 [Hibiscus sabdariffa]
MASSQKKPIFMQAELDVDRVEDDGQDGICPRYGLGKGFTRKCEDRCCLFHSLNFLQLEQIVLDQVDIFAFQPMHPRDCSQLRRLAAIYHLSSGCQSCGKKRFVTVTRTQYTSRPSSSDKLRLEKLIGADDEDADFAVNEGFDMRASDAGRTRAKKAAKGSGSKKASSSNIGESSWRKRSGKKVSYASQPVSFVSSGIMVSETDEVRTTDPEGTSESYEPKGIARSAQFGAFEHTKGFGSKMMAKMGFVEGMGLGKDSQGITNSLVATRLPKSRGLGANR